MYKRIQITSSYDNAIFDVAYNHYGTRMAVSSREIIQVCDKSNCGKWQISSSWKSGYGLVWKLLWLHEIYGELLVTCSVNNVITMWQEDVSCKRMYTVIENMQTKFIQNFENNNEQHSQKYVGTFPEHEDICEYDESNISRTLRKHFSDTKSFIQDGEPDIKKQKFGKHQFNPAMASNAEDINKSEIESSTKLKSGTTINTNMELIENCTSFGEWKIKACINIPAIITDIKFALYSSGLILAVCCSDGSIKLYACMNETCLENWYLKHEIASELSWSCISWTNISSKNLIPLLAAGCNRTEKEVKEPITRTSNVFVSDDFSENSMNDTNYFVNDRPNKHGINNYELRVRIFEFHEIDQVLCPTSITIEVCDPVHCLSFAPSLSNASYHVLAVASCNINIFRIEPKWDTTHSTCTYNVVNMAMLDSNVEQIWNLEWNIVGDLLVSSADNECVRLWKNTADNWNCLCTVKANSANNDGYNV